MKRSHPKQLKVKEDNTAVRVSLCLSFILLILKAIGYFSTNSVALLSDLTESVIHLIIVAFSTFCVWFSHQPADDNHPYGHDRVAFFSSGLEGSMILSASLFIAYEAVERVIYAEDISNLGLGISITLISLIMNLCLGLWIRRQARKRDSLLLDAHSTHLLTDCITDVGVLLSLVLVSVTGIRIWDPLIALVISANIFAAGIQILKKAIGGLMDAKDDRLHQLILETLSSKTQELKINFHQLRHRCSGNKVFVEFHLLFPKDITVDLAHRQATIIEVELHNNISQELEVISHLEPLETHDEIHKQFNLTS